MHSDGDNPWLVRSFCTFISVCLWVAEQIQQSGSDDPIPGGQCVADRIGRRTILLVPLARPQMQGSNLIGLHLQQIRMENICEKMVIAIPLSLIIEWNDKQVAALKGLQRLSAISLPGEGIAKRTT